MNCAVRKRKKYSTLMYVGLQSICNFNADATIALIYAVKSRVFMFGKVSDIFLFLVLLSVLVSHFPSRRNTISWWISPEQKMPIITPDPGVTNFVK